MNTIDPTAPSGVVIRRDLGRPGTWELEVVTEVPGPLPRVFDFFAAPTNLELLTPPFLRFRILTPSPEMRLGALIDYRLKLHGMPIGWRTKIAAWSPPHRFVDEQVRGPYRLWIHEHTFSEIGNRVRVRDRVSYRVPGGSLVHSLFVRRDLLRIFGYRQRAILAHLGGLPFLNAQ